MHNQRLSNPLQQQNNFQNSLQQSIVQQKQQPQTQNITTSLQQNPVQQQLDNQLNTMNNQQQQQPPLKTQPNNAMNQQTLETLGNLPPAANTATDSVLSPTGSSLNDNALLISTESPSNQDSSGLNSKLSNDDFDSILANPSDQIDLINMLQ